LSGNVSKEHGCGIVNQVEGWEEYMGLAAQLNCTNTSCLCSANQVGGTLKELNDDAVVLCSIKPATNITPSKESEDIINVLANYCNDNGYLLHEVVSTLDGLAPGTKQAQGEYQVTHSQLHALMGSRIGGKGCDWYRHWYFIWGYWNHYWYSSSSVFS
jgi:hypothetical protein